MSIEKSFMDVNMKQLEQQKQMLRVSFADAKQFADKQRNDDNEKNALKKLFKELGLNINEIDLNQAKKEIDEKVNSGKEELEADEGRG